MKTLYNKLMEDVMKHSRMIVALAVAFAGSVSPALAGDVEFGKKGLVYESEDENIEFRIGGRLHLDTVDFDSDITPFNDTTKVRRARVYGSVKFGDWKIKVDRDVGGTSKGWKNVWLRYSGWGNSNITAGNQIPPFGLENVGSSNNLTFMERALPNALNARYGVGVKFATYGKSWTAAIGVFGDAIGTGENAKNKGKNISSRVTFAPIKKKRLFVQVGASLKYEEVRDDKGFRIRTYPEVGIANARLLTTGTLLDVDDTISYGVESAVVMGPFSLQGEYMHSMINRTASSNADVGGGYIQASWFITGESRRYSKRNGTFRSVKPRGILGAVEVAARWSRFDLTDGPLLGGIQENWTIGANWYLGRNFRLMANYIFIDAAPNSLGLNEEPEALQFRGQLNF